MKSLKYFVALLSIVVLVPCTVAFAAESITVTSFGGAFSTSRIGCSAFPSCEASSPTPSSCSSCATDGTPFAPSTVGPSGWGGIPVPDDGNYGWTVFNNITVDAGGQFHGWLEPIVDDLVSIDKSTGIATWVGDAGLLFNTHCGGLDFDNSHRASAASASVRLPITIVMKKIVFFIAPCPIMLKLKNRLI